MRKTILSEISRVEQEINNLENIIKRAKESKQPVPVGTFSAIGILKKTLAGLQRSRERLTELRSVRRVLRQRKPNSTKKFRR